MKTIFRAMVLIALTSGSAFSADIAARPYTKAPVYEAPGYNWTGFYVGGHAGYGATRNTDGSFASNNAAVVPGFFGNPVSNDLNAEGGILGIHTGYNLQQGMWVFGVEADFSGAHLNSSRSSLITTAANPPPNNVIGALTMTQNVEWLASVRGRIGATFGSGMVYFTGGGAWAGVDTSANYANFPAIALIPQAAQVSSDRVRSGYVMGGGYEHMFTSNWTVRAEYLYYNFGDGRSDTLSGGAPGGGVAGATTFTFKFDELDIHVVRAAVSYKF